MRQIKLKEIIEDCNKNNIDSKMLRGFCVDVDSKHDFIFIKKHCKYVPQEALDLLGIKKPIYESNYEVNISFEPIHLGYFVTWFDLKSRKYNHTKPTKTLQKQKEYDIKITNKQHEKNCEASRWSNFRDRQRLINWCNAPERSWSTESKIHKDNAIYDHSW